MITIKRKGRYDFHVLKVLRRGGRFLMVYSDVLHLFLTLHRGRDRYDGRQRYALTLGCRDSMVSLVFGDWWQRVELTPREKPYKQSVYLDQRQVA